jgi:7 transmembrane receptor (rhodopsin family)
MVELSHTTQLNNFSSLDSLTFLSSSSAFFLNDDSVINGSSSPFVSYYDTSNNIIENGNLTSNSSSANEDLLSMLNVPYTIMEALVAVTAVIGNALVIIVFYRERRLRRRTNYYIISLALADFLVGLLGIPFAILVSTMSKCYLKVNTTNATVEIQCENWQYM